MTGGYPSPDLEELSGRTGGPPPEPPAWSWPPDSVLRALAASMPAEATTEGEAVAPASADATPTSADVPVSAPAVVAESAAQATPATTCRSSG